MATSYRATIKTKTHSEDNINNRHKHSNNELQTAILFDAENISWQWVDQAIDLAKPFGKPILRAYADFSRQHTKGWEKPALKYGIRTIHQFSYDSKNSSSDFLMANDAYKLESSGKVQNFVIVTNDSDFITPIQLLRQSGAYVHLIAVKGESSDILAESCHSVKFINDTPQPKPVPKTVTATQENKKPTISNKIVNQLKKAYQESEKDPQGWVMVSMISNNAQIKNNPCEKFSTLLKQSGHFQLSSRNRMAKILHK